MKEKITELQEQVDELSRKIDQLTIAVEKLCQTTSRMDTHIDFVEQVYRTLRAPLDYLTLSFRINLPLPNSSEEN